MLVLDAHVRPREERGREAHKSGERDQEHIERIDEEQLVDRDEGSLRDHAQGQSAGSDERAKARGDIDVGGKALVPDGGEHRGPDEWQAEDGDDLVHYARPPRRRLLSGRFPVRRPRWLADPRFAPCLTAGSLTRSP